MKKVIKIDKDGFFLEDVIIQDNEAVPSDCVDIECKEGLYKPKFVNGEWAEGLSQEEIDIIKNTPQPKNELEIAQETINSLGKQLFNAQTQLLQPDGNNATLGQQLFSLQKQLMTKGVL